MKRITLAAVSVVLLAAGAFPGGAAAAGQPDGSYARLTYPGGGGLVFVSYSGTTTVNAGILGLMANRYYVLTGRTIGCQGAPSSANRLFQLTLQADGSGDADVDGADFLAWQRVLRSVWLEPANHSAAPTCALSFNFKKDKSGTGALGIWGKEVVLSLIEKRPDGRAQLSITYNGGSGNDQIQFRGTNAPCGAAAPTTVFNRITSARYSSGIVNLSDAMISSLRSVRVRDMTMGVNMGCYPLSIIAILIG